jgi:hypothetical protein
MITDPTDLSQAPKFDEYEEFVAGSERDDGELCRRCNDYPCRCVRDEIESEEF